MLRKSIKLNWIILILIFCSCTKKQESPLEKMVLMEQKTTIELPKNEYAYDHDLIYVSEKLNLGDTPLEGISFSAYNKVSLSQNYTTLIAHPEWQTYLINFDAENNMVDYLDLSIYSGNCFIENNAIVCNQGYGKPYNTSDSFVVDGKGKFIKTESYVPTTEKKLEAARFDYILEKLPRLEKEATLIPFSEDDYRENYENFIEINKKEFLNIFLETKNQKLGEDSNLKIVVGAIDKQENVEFNFSFKILKEDNTIIPVTFFDKDLEVFTTLILCYNSQKELVDFWFNDYEEFQVESLVVSAEAIKVKKEKKFDTNADEVINTYTFSKEGFQKKD